MPDSAPLSPDRCPLCGGPNACAMAADGGSCWCFSTPIAPGVIERIPEERRGQACVCQACAAGQQAQANDLDPLDAKVG